MRNFGYITNVHEGGYTTPPYNPNTTRIPQITVTGGGVAANSDKLQIVLASILSGVALWKGAPYVPTTASVPETPNIIYQNPVGSNLGGGGNTLGKVESWLKNNTGVALMAAGGLALYLLKPPARRNSIKNGIKKNGLVGHFLQ